VPKGWDDSGSPLEFKMPLHERDFLRNKLSLLSRPEDTALSLLARLVKEGNSFPGQSLELPTGLNEPADDADKSALDIARDAAALAAIGRTVYGALVEQLLARDGGPDAGTFRTQLETHFGTYGDAAARCDLTAAEAFLPELPSYVKDVLRETKEYVRGGKPEKYTTLLDSYRQSEVSRKTARRARLLDTERAAQRRVEWDPARHNTTPLHYRWRVVRDMLADLSGSK
jgi:hypothetical protein